ncbi:MAG: glycoside hydrolase family 20 zincin-like fold domain-containing protein [Victivallaceae bacterium]|nr:glycoside hydrolase family 20 zincin-like fold domain-containing protein [Victivallaceae bacterium]
MKKFLLALSAAFTVAGSSAADPGFVSSSKRGFNLSGNGFELSCLSQVIAASPDWQLRYYTVNAPMTYQNSEDGRFAAMIQNGNDDVFKLPIYRATAGDNGFLIEMEGVLVSDLPTGMEYTAMMMPVRLLSGAEYTAKLDDGSAVSGTIPENYDKTMVHYYFKGAREMTFNTRYGRLAVSVQEGPALNLGDRRYNQFENRNGFWLGSEQFMIEKNVPVKSRILVTFEPNDAIQTAVIREVENTTAELEPKADLVAAPPPAVRPMLPAVKEIARTGKEYAPAGEENIAISGVDAVETARLSRAVDRVLGKQTGVPVDKLSLKITVDPENPVKNNPEGYRLSVSPDGVVIASATPRGAFYALQTLRNLYNPKTAAFSGAEIVDWPDLAYRGAMFLIDDYSTVFHKDLIENILAPLKMNEIIMECEYAKWDTTAALHRPGAISKEQIRELIAVANDNYMDASPLFQTLGHCEWLFGENADRNPDWAEDPDFPYAYNVSAPGLYDFMDATLDEIVETFNHPKYLHIGHDEVFFFQDAKFPNRPENLAKGAKKIIYDDIMHYYNYAKQRNMRLMIWHDMFVTKQECPENGFGGEPHHIAELRPQLPKDIVIADWRYAGTYTDYPDVRAFRNDGFDVIGATWYDKGNHEHLTPAVKAAGGIGMLQTVWNGYFGNRDVLFDGFNQVAPYTRTATWSWDARPEANRYDSHELASAMLDPLKTLPSGPGFAVDLDGAANIEITPENNPFLYGDASAAAVMLAPESVRVGQVFFDLPKIDGNPAAVTVQSKLNPGAPREVVVPLNGVEASRLFFLHTTMDEQLERFEPVAKLTAIYADGSMADIPVKYYSEIAPMSDEDNFKLGPSNRLRNGDAKIWYSTWENPAPEMPIRAVIVEPVAKHLSYYLFGISAQK